jgi:hypothetical protein
MGRDGSGIVLQNSRVIVPALWTEVEGGMTNSVSDMSQTNAKDGRAEWERPVLSRLAANVAQTNLVSAPTKDGGNPADKS